MAIRKIDIGIHAKLQLPALLRCRGVDPCLRQPVEVVLTLIRIHNMNRPMATLEPVPDKWQQDPIFFVGIIEERADMARLVELGTSKRNCSRRLLHRISPHRITSGAPVVE